MAHVLSNSFQCCLLPLNNQLIDWLSPKFNQPINRLLNVSLLQMHSIQHFSNLMCQFVCLCVCVCRFHLQSEYLSMINLIFFALKSVNFTPQFLCSEPVPINQLSPIIYGQIMAWCLNFSKCTASISSLVILMHCCAVLYYLIILVEPINCVGLLLQS